MAPSNCEDMEVNYLNHEEFEIDVSPFAGYVGKLEGAVDTRDGDLNVVFVNDKYIRALNKAYRSKDKPTDVLSFIYDYDRDEEGIIGEVYISVETAKRQAKDHKHPLSDELTKLVIHGILHVHGYDHEKDEDYEKMYKVEKGVLGKLAGEKMLHV